MKDIYFISKEGNFEAIVRSEKDLCIVLLGGTADTNQAGELHDIIEKKYLTGKKAFNYIIDIEKLRYISSTGIGILIGMRDDAKEFVAIASASERMKKNLSTHGLIQFGPDAGYIQAYDTPRQASGKPNRKHVGPVSGSVATTGRKDIFRVARRRAGVLESGPGLVRMEQGNRPLCGGRYTG